MASRYQELQMLAKDYGDEARKFYPHVRTLGKAIIQAYIEYIDGPIGSVTGIPPEGSYDHDGPYEDAIFSFYGAKFVNLTSVSMGICTQLNDVSGSGFTSVRTVLEFRPDGDDVQVLVGLDTPLITLTPNDASDLSKICHAIFNDVRSAFALDVRQAQGTNRIGYWPDSS